MNNDNEIRKEDILENSEDTSEKNEEALEEPVSDVVAVKHNKGFSYFMREYALPILFQAIFIYLFIKFVAFLTIVPTPSMSPTVEPHSAVVATRMYAPEKTVQRGDIIIFNSKEMNEYLFKRCIGLPGEFVQINEDGSIEINGAPLKEPYVKNKCEQLPQSFQIPEGHYLFLGDNRSGSFDAREWEEPYISSDEFVGEARFTIWPLEKFGGFR